jgi:hypothetical protein
MVKFGHPRCFLKKTLFFIIEKEQEEIFFWDYLKNKKGFLLFPSTKKNIYTTYVGLWPSLHSQTLCSHLGIRLRKKDPNLLTMTLIILFVEMLNFSYLFYL